MTIGVYLSSRGNYNQLFSVIVEWQTLAADNSQIQYLIGIDEDDEEGKKFPQCDNTKLLLFKPDVLTQGQRSKLLADALDVDYYISINDHTFMTTQDWDQKVNHIMRYEHIVGFNDQSEVDGFNVSCVSKAWHQAVTEFEPQLFPFWFCDAWRLEMGRMVFYREPPRTSFIQVGGRHGKSQSLRELDYWWGLFYALRPLRLKEAHTVALRFGTASEDFEEFKESRKFWLDICEKNDLGMRLKLGEHEKFFGKGGEPSGKYLKAKSSADDYMKANNLKIWECRW